MRRRLSVSKFPTLPSLCRPWPLATLQLHCRSPCVCGYHTMNSFDFKADRHKIIAHRGVCQPRPAAQPPPQPGKSHRPDLLDRLIDQHPLLHHIELLVPSDESASLSPLLTPPPVYHLSARLTAFLSASFLLPLLSSGSLAAFTLCTPIDRCNTFTLFSFPTPSSSPSTTATAATFTLTLDDDTYQQLGLTGQPLSAQPGFHVVTVPIQSSTWQPSSRLYQRVHTCLAAMPEVELLVQHCRHSGQDGGEAHFTAAEGVRLVKRVKVAEQRWQANVLAIPDVSAVWLAGCKDSDRATMLRQQRKDAQQQVDQLDVELLDWIGLATHHLVDLLPPQNPDTALSLSSSPSLIDHPFCTSLPLLAAAAPPSLASLRYTGLLAHGHVWRSLLSHGWSLLARDTSLPWVCLSASSVVDAGNVVGVDCSGNGENDWSVMLLRGGRYLLYQLANASTSIH